ncbi:UNVERIFIED_CONTAM: hypothetical protein FKN15_019516 [Acipenser sinensis]
MAVNCVASMARLLRGRQRALCVRGLLANNSKRNHGEYQMFGKRVFRWFLAVWHNNRYPGFVCEKHTPFNTYPPVDLQFKHHNIVTVLITTVES